jgi:hypothetical protein
MMTDQEVRTRASRRDCEEGGRRKGRRGDREKDEGRREESLTIVPLLFCSDFVSPAFPFSPWTEGGRRVTGCLSLSLFSFFTDRLVSRVNCSW